MIDGMLKIECAICRRQVDEVIHWRDVGRRTDVIEVKCHGDIDSCEIVDMGAFIEQGVVNIVGMPQAFTRARLA